MLSYRETQKKDKSFFPLIFLYFLAMFFLFIFAVFLFTAFIFPATTLAYDGDEEYLRGRVLKVSESPALRSDIQQDAVVKIISGKYRGEEMEITHHYRPSDLYSVNLEEGLEVIIVKITGGIEDRVILHDVARDRGVYYLLAVFIFLLLLVGRGKGLKALLMLAFMIFFIIKILLPLVVRGYNPIWISVATCIILASVTLLVILGFNRKTLAAVSGTVTGLLVAGFLALWTGEMSHLTGFSSEEAQMLFYLGQNVNIRDLLFAGIIIGALGAIIDVGVSVASAAAEIKEAKPDISITSLTTGAMNVGRDVMATMSNTMILAYVGAAIPLLLLIIGLEMPWQRIINLDLMATEIVRGVSISIGIIITVPVTALLAGLLMGIRENK